MWKFLGVAKVMWQGLIHHYYSYLPVTAATPIVTLYEGNTPLIPVPKISSYLGKKKRPGVGEIRRSESHR